MKSVLYKYSHKIYLTGKHKSILQIWYLEIQLGGSVSHCKEYTIYHIGSARHFRIADEIAESFISNLYLTGKV